jgi:hypothetical protein
MLYLPQAAKLYNKFSDRTIENLLVRIVSIYQGYIAEIKATGFGGIFFYDMRNQFLAPGNSVLLIVCAFYNTQTVSG